MFSAVFWCFDILFLGIGLRLLVYHIITGMCSTDGYGRIEFDTISITEKSIRAISCVATYHMDDAMVPRKFGVS